MKHTKGGVAVPVVPRKPSVPNLSECISRTAFNTSAVRGACPVSSPVREFCVDKPPLSFIWKLKYFLFHTTAIFIYSWLIPKLILPVGLDAISRHFLTHRLRNPLKERWCLRRYQENGPKMMAVSARLCHLSLVMKASPEQVHSANKKKVTWLEW